MKKLVIIAILVATSSTGCAAGANTKQSHEIWGAVVDAEAQRWAGAANLGSWPALPLELPARSIQLHREAWSSGTIGRASFLAALNQLGAQPETLEAFHRQSAYSAVIDSAQIALPDQVELAEWHPRHRALEGAPPETTPLIAVSSIGLSTEQAEAIVYTSTARSGWQSEGTSYGWANSESLYLLRHSDTGWEIIRREEFFSSPAVGWYSGSSVEAAQQALAADAAPPRR